MLAKRKIRDSSPIPAILRLEAVWFRTWLDIQKLYMKAFGNFRINTKPNVQSEGQAEQDNGEQILSPTF